MTVLLQVDFSYIGPFGEDNISGNQWELAKSIAEEKGLIWKIWTENAQTLEAGGIYLFDNAQNAEAYLLMHSQRLQDFGINDINAKIFSINKPLTLLDKFPETALQ